MSTPQPDLQFPPGSADALELEPSLPSVARAMEWLEGLAERDGWPARTLFALTLCADEALTNVISYAQLPQQQPVLRLECARTPYGVALRIEDNGAPFDPTAQESPELAPSLDEASVGGHGLRLMRHYLHVLHYQRKGERNVLWLGAAWAQ